MQSGYSQTGISAAAIETGAVAELEWRVGVRNRSWTKWPGTRLDQPGVCFERPYSCAVLPGELIVRCGV